MRSGQINTRITYAQGPGLLENFGEDKLCVIYCAYHIKNIIVKVDKPAQHFKYSLKNSNTSKQVF